MHPWLDSVLDWADSQGGDCLLEEGKVPAVRLQDKWILAASAEPVPAGLLEDLVLSNLDSSLRETLATEGFARVMLSTTQGRKARATLYRHSSGLGMSLRSIGPAILAEALAIPEVLRNQLHNRSGILLFCGAQSGGKTSAARWFCNQFCSTRPRKALIRNVAGEMELDSPDSLIQYLDEVDWRNLDHLCEGDTDILFSGDITSLHDASLLLQAADAGLLAVGVVEAPQTVEALERLVGIFPAEDRVRVRGILSLHLKGVFALQALPGLDGKRHTLWELLFNTTQVSGLVRSGDWGKIPSAMRVGNTDGMVLMDDSLAELVQQGKVEKKAAALRAQEQARFE